MRWYIEVEKSPVMKAFTFLNEGRRTWQSHGGGSQFVLYNAANGARATSCAECSAWWLDGLLFRASFYTSNWATFHFRSGFSNLCVSIGVLRLQSVFSNSDWSFPRLLKTCAAELEEPLQWVFNVRLHLRKVPTLRRTGPASWTTSNWRH